MLVSRRPRFVFLAFQRTGSTSIQEALEHHRSMAWHRLFHLRIQWEGTEAGPPFKHPKHLRAARVRALMGRRAWAKYPSFAFVRNPWDRVVSVYHYQRQQHPERHPIAGLEFREYILRGGSGSAQATFTDFVSDPESGEVLVDFIGRFERLAEDFEEIGRKLGLEAALPHVNRSDHHGYRQYYDDETRELVAEWCKRDIEWIGYTF